RIVSEMQSLRQEVSRFQIELVGKVVIGAPPALAVSHLPPLLSHSIRSFPRLKLALKVGIWSRSVNALRSGDLDFCVEVRSNIADEPDINLLPIGIFRGMGIFCRSGHPLSTGDTVGDAQLREFPLLSGGLDKMLAR